jgi:hypothetical protein
LETQTAPRRSGVPVKVTASTTLTHNPWGEAYWASGLRENLTSRSYGEGLETGRILARHRASPSPDNW